MGIASIVTNIHAQYASGNIRSSLDALKTSTIRLSSGKQITEAKDGPADLAIGVGLTTDESTQKAALTTTGQAKAVLSIMDGALDNTGKILGKLKALASQANAGVMSDVEKGYIKQEMDALLSQLDTIVEATTFNGNKLIDGTFTNKAFQVGLKSTDIITIDFATAATQSGLGLGAVDVVTDVDGANNALDAAITTLKGMRSDVGALQSRFEYAATNLETTIANTSAAKSIYLDADFSKVSTEFASQQTMLQSATATLAQVNQLTANLLKLIS